MNNKFKLIVSIVIVGLFTLTNLNASPISIVVVDFTMKGDLGGSQFKVPHEKRIKMASEKLRKDILDNRIYYVIDHKIASVVTKRISAGQYIHSCNGCELDIAKELGADYILLPWVFRMSNLVLAMHFEIKEVATGKIVMREALDFRGDNDKGWIDNIDYFIELLEEKEGKNIFL